jgi:outer membrane lipoprotein SlyB
MQANTNRLHPLLTAAAISVTVLSGVGVAAMTGVLPVSKSQESALELPKEVAKPIEPAISHPVTKPAVRKPVVRRPAPAAVQPVSVNETTAIAQTVPVVEAAKPQPALGQLAVVESVREVRDPGEAKGVGAIAGGVTGLVLGKKLGKDKDLVTILGAAGGAIAGHQIERQVRATKHWEIAVRLDDGSQRMLTSEAQPAWRAGDRVRLLDDKLLPV